MRPLDLKPTNHSYYCSTARWDQRRDEVAEFDCWEDFKDDWCPKGITYDDDLNHLFRFDFQYKYEDETDDNTGPMQLLLFFMLQRKGLFVPVTVNNITEADMPEITEFLQKRWEYLKGQWTEFSALDAVDPKEAMDFIESYKFVDDKEVYTNGAELVPMLRVKQALQDKAYNGFFTGGGS